MAVTFDNTAMITNDLRNECQSQPRTIGLRGHEGIEQMRQHILRHTGSVIVYTEFERQGHPIPRARHLQTNTWTISRGQDNLAALTIAYGFRGILQEIEKDLHELVTIGENRRERRIIIFHKADLPCEPVLRNRLHMIQNRVNVDRRALDGALVRENFHAVNQ